MYNLRLKKQLFLVFIDALLLLFSVFITMVIRYQRIPDADEIELYYTLFTPGIIVTIMFMYFFYLYSFLVKIKKLKTMVLLALSVTIGCIFDYILSYVFTGSIKIIPEIIVLINGFNTVILLSIWRSLYIQYYSSIKKQTQVFFIGNSKSIEEIIVKLYENKYYALVPALIYDKCARQNNETITNDIQKFIIEIEKSLQPIIVYTDQYEFNKDTLQYVYKCFNRRIDFYTTAMFMELVFRKIPLNEINISWLLENIHIDHKRSYLVIKRLSDIILSSIGLILTSWLYPFIALTIKISGKGPVFFKQQREGEQSKCFTMLKFRTMTVENNDGSMTAEHDTRITKCGNFLRKSRLDELPQLLNVLKGDMSLIGPRPERPEYVEQLEKEISFYRTRLIIKPGITGWDQVSGEYHSASVEDTYKKLQNDLYYIKEMSIFLDISISCKTICTMIKKEGI